MTITSSHFSNMAEDLDAKIVKQVEFYFSDSNIVKDKFLMEATKKNPEGFVPIETLLTFNRLKTLTTDKQVVANALKKSDKLVVCKVFAHAMC